MRRKQEFIFHMFRYFGFFVLFLLTVSSAFPALAGQHATYLGKMLSAFKNGTSWGEDDDQSQVMVEVVSRMTEEEIAAVSSYIQGLYSNQAE